MRANGWLFGKRWFFGCLFGLAATPAFAGAAATLTVNDAGDAGDGTCTTVCTLRDAIPNVTIGGTIDFDPSILPATITLAKGALTIGKSLHIQGPGAARLQISAAASDRVVIVDGSFYGLIDVTVSDLALRDGMTVGADGPDAADGNGAPGLDADGAVGACIFASSASLQLERVAISNCVAHGGDGGNGGTGKTGTGLGTGGKGGDGGLGGRALGSAIYFVGEGGLVLLASSISNAQAIGGKGGVGGAGGSGFLQGAGGRGGNGGDAAGAAVYFYGGKMNLINTTTASSSATSGNGGNGGAGDPGLTTSPGGNGGDGGLAVGALVTVAGPVGLPQPPAVAELDFVTAADGQVIGGAPGSGGSGGKPGNSGQAGLASGAAIWATQYTTARSTAIVGVTAAPLCDGPPGGPFVVTPGDAVNLAQDTSCGAPLHATLTDAFRPLSAPLGLPAYMPVYAAAVIDAAASCSDSAAHVVTSDQQGTPRPQGPACDVGAIEADYVFVGDFD